MLIKMQNKIGSFEIGGGSHPIARLTQITGIGLLNKEESTVVFAGQPGRTLTSVRDMERAITLSFDFYGDERVVEKLYHITYHPLTLTFYLGNRRRKIEARCKTATDINSIIYHKWQSIVLQFVCDDPYFYDVCNTEEPISMIVDQLPNVNENTQWYVSLPAIATVRSNRAVITNSGDIDIYPIIKLKNNASDAATISEESYIILRNLTTGKFVRLDYEIAADETIIINLPNRAITSDVNGNITNYISSDTVLSDFILQLGDNEIEIESTSNNVYSVIEYSNKYISVVI